MPTRRDGPPGAVSTVTRRQANDEQKVSRAGKIAVPTDERAERAVLATAALELARRPAVLSADSGRLFHVYGWLHGRVAAAWQARTLGLPMLVIEDDRARWLWEGLDDETCARLERLVAGAVPGIGFAHQLAWLHELARRRALIRAAEELITELSRGDDAHDALEVLGSLLVPA